MKVLKLEGIKQAEKNAVSVSLFHYIISKKNEIDLLSDDENVNK